MSVPLGDRGESGMEFYHNALVLRKEITGLLLRDFGLKKKIRTIEILVKMYKIEPSDKETLQSILTKYRMDSSVIDEYPEWLIKDFRDTIITTLRNLRMNIRMGNSIYVTTKAEFDERRNCWNRAIGSCQQLLEEMQFVIETLPVDAEKYMRYVGMIEKEIKLLKGVRKADNKILGRL